MKMTNNFTVNNTMKYLFKKKKKPIACNPGHKGSQITGLLFSSTFNWPYFLLFVSPLRSDVVILGNIRIITQ